MNSNSDPSSYKDPSGFVFTEHGTIYRQIHNSYKDHYLFLKHCGLYESLTRKNLLITHREIISNKTAHPNIFKIIQPETIPFISYPYEWSAGMLKDAALLTLEIQKIALLHNMILKDATGFNIQFLRAKPIFIDTLSFEKYTPGQPWIAYKQFCQHFLAPLALISHKDVRLKELLKVFLDGIPLDLASQLLPQTTYLNPGLLIHLHLHARGQKYLSNNKKPQHHASSKESLVELTDSLIHTVSRLSWNPPNTQWSNYEQEDSYTQPGMTHKKELVKTLVQKIRPNIVWDLGANTGIFTRLISPYTKKLIVSCDSDEVVVEKNYLSLKKSGADNILPLLIDITNPTPALGFENKERHSLSARGPADLVLALALVHHLAITHNIPLAKIAGHFSTLTNWLIIEFVPKTDKKIQKMLLFRDDIFPNYTQQMFETEFQHFFKITEKHKVTDSNRILYLMKKHD